MTTVPFKCDKTGAAFLPEEGGTCAVCGKLVMRQYLWRWTFDECVRFVCEDDFVLLSNCPKRNGTPE